MYDVQAAAEMFRYEFHIEDDRCDECGGVTTDLPHHAIGQVSTPTEDRFVHRFRCYGRLVDRLVYEGYDFRDGNANPVTDEAPLGPNEFVAY